MDMETETAADGDEPDCAFRHCFCLWCRLCPRIPHVAPGRDYERVPPAPDDRAAAAAAWSVFIGFVSFDRGNERDGSRLRLRRFRVAPSGRVLGWSDDVLDNVLDGVDYGAKGVSFVSTSAATLTSPDGALSLSLFCKEVDNPRFRAVQLDLDLGLNAAAVVPPLPDLPPGPSLPVHPISAAGELWAPCFTAIRGPCHLVMRRLRRHAHESELWETVATMAVDSPAPHHLLTGYAVVGRGGGIILLSLRYLFVVFDCSAAAFIPVYFTAGGAKKSDYFLLPGRCPHVEEDDTIYFLHNQAVYAYKLEQHGQGHYRMPPPTPVVDRLCPFTKNEGLYHQFLTHLGGRDMCYCYIWVNPELGFCNCNGGGSDFLHLLITTFRVNGSISQSNPKGLGFQILHSTCRRIDISRNKAINFFYFIQEHKEFNHENTMPRVKKRRENSMPPSILLEVPASSSNVVQSSKILPCCREFLNMKSFAGAVMLEGSAIQIKKALYIICQVSSHSTVYEISILNGKLPSNGKTLKSKYDMETFVCDGADDQRKRPLPWEGRPLSWHFVCDSTSIYGVPYKGNTVYKCDLDLGTLDRLHVGRPDGDDFPINLVLQVGYKIIAISDTLGDVYHWCSWTCKWERRSICGIYGPVDLEMKVNLSGYVVLSDESFMVYDEETSGCFHFDLMKDTWSSVMPYPDESRTFPGQERFLCERSVFAAGFIYSCTYGGLAAYEKIELGDDSHSLGDRILLSIPWPKHWEASTMCLDYVGMDETSGAIMFCVVQGEGYYNSCDRWGAPPNHHSVWITTIQVHTELMSDGKLKPAVIGHVDVGTWFVKEDRGRPFWTTTCFAVEAGR